MKGLKLAAKSMDYTLTYDKSVRCYAVKKEGYKTLYYSKADFELMPVWRFVSVLKSNDQEVD